MKIVFITTAHNSMSQRAFIELTDKGHTVDIILACEDQEMILQVVKFKPDLILAPFLKTAIPEYIWSRYPCIIIHPGIKGDRGPYSLDWAIMNQEQEWGVTLLQANGEMDSGDIWSAETFQVRAVSKSHLYRHAVTQAAMTCLLDTINKINSGTYKPEPLNDQNPDIKGKLHPKIKQADRKIDWNEPTDAIARKIRAADSSPGVWDTIYGNEYYLYGVHEDDALRGTPGHIIASRDGAICRATGDGAVWITHLKPKNYFKLPASLILKDKLAGIPEMPLNPFDKHSGRTWKEIRYEEHRGVGYIHFDFYNGAMNTDQCERLRLVLIEAKKRDTKVIVLMGGADFWSNGIHLNVIEHAADPGEESWRNIHAMNDLVQEIILAGSHIVIAAMQGNAGAGGVILALAADYIYSREGIVFNPHYKKMGGLYGSEYWTYLLPKRVGLRKALELTDQCLPMGTSKAKSIGLIDDTFGKDVDEFRRRIEMIAEDIAASKNYMELLCQKAEMRRKDEALKPLETYRMEELERMRQNFFGDDNSYHMARHRFVYKLSCSKEVIQV